MRFLSLVLMILSFSVFAQAKCNLTATGRTSYQVMDVGPCFDNPTDQCLKVVDLAGQMISDRLYKVRSLTQPVRDSYTIFANFVGTLFKAEIRTNAGGVDSVRVKTFVSKVDPVRKRGDRVDAKDLVAVCEEVLR